MRNDPKTIAKLLRAIASGSDAKQSQHDIIFRAAADLLDGSQSMDEASADNFGLTEDDLKSRHSNSPPDEQENEDGIC